MKILLAVTLLTAAVATPALAQTTVRTQDQWRGPNAYGQDYSAGRNYSAYAYVNGQRRLDNRNDVYDISGHYLGSDPDSSVRDQLARDPRQGG